MKVGTCKYCGHEPVAEGAVTCPKCGGGHPNPEPVNWLKLALVVIGTLAFIVAAFALSFR